MKKFYLGNCLRGYCEGEFTNIEDAWDVLCARFNLSFPSVGGRNVCLWIEEENQYGFNDATPCKVGITHIDPVSPDKTDKCKWSSFFR